ncbi:MAG: DsbA family oxidoreductase [Gemmobacter sp.]|jgi:predicted DsbA family dithiol-disulfide isomerase
MIDLDVYADPVCPWCAIGKAELDRALAARPDHPFVRRWLPFELNPDLPPEGVPRAAYLEEKFGAEAVGAMLGRVTEAAARAGVAMDFARVARQPNTRDAHRLILWAGVEGLQDDVMAALMRAHFEQGRDIGDAPTLAEIAAEAGMDAAVVRRLIGSQADCETVAAMGNEARMMGITGVPSVVIGGAHVVVGAQPADVWLRIIDDIAAHPDRWT